MTVFDGTNNAKGFFMVKRGARINAFVRKATANFYMVLPHLFHHLFVYVLLVTYSLNAHSTNRCLAIQTVPGC